jgi:hypothetical protein
MSNHDFDTFLETNKDILDCSFYHSFDEAKQRGFIRGLTACGYCSQDGVFLLNEEGRRFFSFSSSVVAPFLYFDGDSRSLRNLARPAERGPFQVLSLFLDQLEATVPTIEDRRDLLRKDVPQISSKLVRSTFSSVLAHSNFFKNAIVVEHVSQFCQMKIRSLSLRPCSPAMLNFVRFLQFSLVVPWQSASIRAEAVRKGLLIYAKEPAQVVDILVYQTSLEQDENTEWFVEPRLSPAEKAAYRLLRVQSSLTKAEFIAKTGMSPRNAAYALTGLCKKGLLKREGGLTSRQTYYHL